MDHRRTDGGFIGEAVLAADLIMRLTFIHLQKQATVSTASSLDLQVVPLTGTAVS